MQTHLLFFRESMPTRPEATADVSHCESEAHFSIPTMVDYTEHSNPLPV